MTDYRPVIVGGCWKIYSSMADPIIHPAIRALLLRDGYAARDSAGRLVLTEKGHAVINDTRTHFLEGESND